MKHNWFWIVIAKKYWFLWIGNKGEEKSSQTDSNVFTEKETVFILFALMHLYDKVYIAFVKQNLMPTVVPT